MKAVTRREVLVSTGTAALAVTACAALSACQAQEKETSPLVTTGTVNVGAASDYPAGTASVKFVATNGIVIVNDSGTPIAIRPKCTHLGCTAKWVDAAHEFECPCHGSHFNLLGEAIKGPAKRPLPAVPCAKNADGTLSVDLTKLYSL